MVLLRQSDFIEIGVSVATEVVDSTRLGSVHSESSDKHIESGLAPPKVRTIAHQSEIKKIDVGISIAVMNTARGRNG